MLKILNLTLLVIAMMTLLACENSYAGASNEKTTASLTGQQAGVMAESKRGSTPLVEHPGSLPASEFKTVDYPEGLKLDA